jgi:serine phosphatase RsbU (regulator of sigma subunit)
MKSYSEFAVQTGLLLPSLRTPLAGLEYYGQSRPAHETGSDFFDFLALDSHSLICSIGEVNGSGISASFTQASLQAFLRGMTRDRRGSLATTIGNLNRVMYEISPDSFYASLFYAWIDPIRGQMQYVNAGHESVLLLSRTGPHVRRLENTGTVVGLSLRVSYRQRTVDVAPGDLLLAMSDGVTEALREEEILALLDEHAQARPVDLVNHLLDAAGGVADCTAIAVRIKGPAANLVLEADAELTCTAA